MVRTGIFAGTFDPIHDGHLFVAKESIRTLSLDELFFMVERNPWGTKKPVSFNHRSKMIELAIRDQSKMGVLQTADERFSIDRTLMKLEEQFNTNELYFIFGADVFLRMNEQNWPGLHRLLKHYIVVFERADITERQIAEHAKSLGIVVAIIPSTHMHHRSTDVRLHPHKKYIWVPKPVADYSSKFSLY